MVILIGISSFGILINKEVKEFELTTNALYEHPFIVSGAARDARLATSRIRNELLYALAIRSKKDHTDISRKIQQLDATIDASLTIIEANFLGDLSKVSEAKQYLEEWRKERGDLVNLLILNQDDEAEHLLIASSGPTYSELINRLDYVLAFATKKAESLAKEAQNNSADARAQFDLLLGGFALFSLLTGALTSILVLRMLRSRDIKLAMHQKRLDVMSENIPGFATFMLDPKGCVSSWNEGAKRLKGYEADEIIGRPIDCFYPPEDIRDGKPQRMLEQALRDGIFEDRGWRVRKDGSRFYGDVIICPLIDNDDLIGFIKITRDISDRYKFEDRLRAVFESAPIPLIMVDRDGLIRMANNEVGKHFGYENGNLIGKSLDLLIPERYRFGHTANIQRFISEESKPMRLGTDRDLFALDKDSHEFPVELGLGIVDTDTDRYAMASINNITERKRLEDEVRQLAFHDPLTRLPNRRLLNDRISQIQATSKRTGCHCALMFLDLDNFKPLNDRHGHQAGDLLLIEVANRLKSFVREMDTVARFGGDEFVVLISELDTDKSASVAQAKIIAEKILSGLAKPYKLTIQHESKTETTIEHQCSASIGVVVFLSNEATQDDILKWADLAMYQAKQLGRNSIQLHKLEVKAAA